MAKAIENIAFYCFNDHKECESWCKYSSNPDTYIHSVIGGAFTNENLFEDLKQLFNSFAQKSDQFAAGASSNVNVSLNAMIVSKASKNRLYGKWFAEDTRVACAISKKK